MSATDPAAPTTVPVPPAFLPHVVEVLELVTSPAEIDEVLRRLVTFACDLTGAAFGMLSVLDDDGFMRDFYIHGLDDRTVDAMGDLPVGRGVLGRLLRSDRPLRLDDVAASPESVGLPPGHPPVERFLGVGIDEGSRRLGVLYIGDPSDREPYDELDEHRLQWLADRAAHAIGAADARRRADRRARWLRSTQELAVALEPPLDPEAGPDRFLEAVGPLLGATAVALVRVGDEAVELVAGATAGSGQDPTDPATSVGAAVLATYAQAEPAVRRVDGCAVVVVPVELQLTERLVLVASLPRGTAAPEREDVELLAGYAAQAATALDRAHALAERQELVMLADRERIARDLHDVVIQRLFATGLQLQTARAGADAALVERIDATVSELDATIVDIRTTVFELSRRADRSLRSDVRELATEYAGPLGFAPVVRVRGPVDSLVPETVGDHLLATLREGLANAVRHAHAGQVEVAVEVVDASGPAGGHVVELRITDDGDGLPEQVVESGLRNVRRRAHAFGGELRVTSEPGAGTTLAWTVPLPVQA